MKGREREVETELGVGGGGGGVEGELGGPGRKKCQRVKASETDPSHNVAKPS